MHLSKKAVQCNLLRGNVFKHIYATPNTLQHECFHVTFKSNDEKFVLLQLTVSVIF